MNDDAHQLTSVAASRPSDAARYRYDAAGNPVDRAELGRDVTNSFNNLNQIVTGSWTGATLTVAGSVNYPVGSISVNGQPGTVYPDSTFDVANVPVVPGTNTLTATYVGPAYTNALMTATDTSTVVLGDTLYTHDPNGNLTDDATFIYQYDTANQLTNVIRKADSVSVLQCRYDALGRRVEAIRADGTVDRYVYFPGSFLVLAVLDEANAPKEFYTRGPDLSGTLASAGGIGGILACTYANAPTAPLYHHADLMGNVITLTDSSATLISTFRYAPFGQLVAHSASILPRFLFSSKEWESGTGLIYYGYRYYSNVHNLWLTRDVLSEHGGINLYGFLGNTPFASIDAWGGEAEWASLIMSGFKIVSGALTGFVGGAMIATGGPAGIVGGTALAGWGVSIAIDGIQEIKATLNHRETPQPLFVQGVSRVYKITTGETLGEKGLERTYIVYYAIDIGLSCYSIHGSWITMVQKASKARWVSVGRPGTLAGTVVKYQSTINFRVLLTSRKMPMLIYDLNAIREDTMALWNMNEEEAISPTSNRPPITVDMDGVQYE